MTDAVHFHDAQVGHEGQHCDIPAHVVTLPEFVDDMLKL